MRGQKLAGVTKSIIEGNTIQRGVISKVYNVIRFCVIAFVFLKIRDIFLVSSD